jgi:3-dehydroquinate dehydratase/shikimate dehydrogenase
LSRKTLLAVPLTRSDPPLEKQVVAAVGAGAEVIELRVDLIRNDGAVETLLRKPHAVPFIVTVRSTDEGGAWWGSEAERIALLERLGRYQPAYVDLELEAFERLGAGHGGTEARRHEGGAGARFGDALILSLHDFAGTSPEIREVFDRLEASQADVVKAVFTAEDALDSFRVLAELRRLAERRRAIALAMGEAGLATRVLAKKFGALLTFVALEHGAESAPGQRTIAELREVYRWDAIEAQTPVFGVIGWPVTHSLSPRLHNAAMAEEGIDGVYLPLPVRPSYEHLASFLDYVTSNRWLDLAGMSVTIPHKQHVAHWLDERGYRISDLARRCGAVNTLVRQDDGWRGENTDATGALRALESVPELADGRLAGRQVDVLGAGGAALAVVAGLTERGCQVTVYNRNEERARTLAQRLRCAWKPWQQRASGSGTVLVNCTSVGMTPDVDSSPVPAERLGSGMVVFDSVYNPAQTRLLREAQERDCRTISGVEMFIGQAAEQFALWHGREAPPDTLRRIL